VLCYLERYMSQLNRVQSYTWAIGISCTLGASRKSCPLGPFLNPLMGSFSLNAVPWDRPSLGDVFFNFISYNMNWRVFFVSYLVAAAILQCLWSLSLAIVDIYALLVKRSLRNARAVCIFTIGDGVSNLFSLSYTKELCNKHVQFSFPVQRSTFYMSDLVSL
jgi:hypothetical protein